MKKNAIQKRKKNTKGVRERNLSFKYSFHGDNQEDHEVCQTFFLRTLGFKSHKILQIVVRNSTSCLPIPDARDKSTPMNKLSGEVMRDIDAHIASYGPTISHYRRAHAPNCLHLCPELSISEMH